jgi:hypothetical protein
MNTNSECIGDWSAAAQLCMDKLGAMSESEANELPEECMVDIDAECRIDLDSDILRLKEAVMHSDPIELQHRQLQEPWDKPHPDDYVPQQDVFVAASESSLNANGSVNAASAERVKDIERDLNGHSLVGKQ